MIPSKTSILISACLLLSCSGLAHAKQFTPSAVSSNSILVDDGITYKPENMLSDKADEMWVEGEGSSGMGKYVKIEFDGEIELAKVRIWAGCFQSEEFFQRYNRIAAVEFKYPDFTSEKFELKDVMEGQWIELSKPKKLDSFKIYLRRAYDSTTWNATPITKIQFFDQDANTGRIEGITATASSEYADKDHLYGPAKAVDGWIDTPWCNGEGSGEKDWLDLDLGGEKTLKSFAINIGRDLTQSSYEGSNRVGQVTLEFDGGKKMKFAIPKERGLQRFDLPSAVSTREVKVTFQKIIKGKSHDDLYVGEIIFWE